MLIKSLRFASFLVALTAIGWPSDAFAQKKKKAEPPTEEVKLEEEKPSEEPPAETTEEEAPKEEAPKEEEAAPKEAAGGEQSLVEEKGQSYYTVGVRFRGLFIPAFMIEAFGEGGDNVFAPSFGAEFGIRRDGFEYLFGVSYASYVLTHTPFKSPTDPIQAMELVDAHLKVLYFTADFQWSTQLNPAVAWTYGGGAGLGFVWGPLGRVQAYPDSGAENGWDYCPGAAQPTDPPIFQEYCQPDPDLGDDPQHWPGYEEPSWADGVSKPILFPWLAIQTGLRFKPHRNFVGRLDVGIGFGQLWFGVGADYGL